MNDFTVNVIGKTAYGALVLDNGFTMSGIYVDAFEEVIGRKLPVLVYDTILGVYIEAKEKENE